MSNRIVFARTDRIELVRYYTETNPFWKIEGGDWSDWMSLDEAVDWALDIVICDKGEIFWDHPGGEQFYAEIHRLIKVISRFDMYMILNMRWLKSISITKDTDIK